MFELIEDNQGGSVATDATFSTTNANSADLHMGSDAPASRYIAALLDQQSIKVSDQYETLISLDQSQMADIEGPWKFKVTGCVTDSSASLICDQTGREFIVEVVDPCSVTDFDFVAQGTTRTENCGCEWTTSDDVDNYSTLTEEIPVYETLQ